MGSFRLATGSEHLHSHCNFAEPIVERVFNSLCHSCRTELTRQGISLGSLPQLCGTLMHNSSESVYRYTARTISYSAFADAGVWSLRIFIKSFLDFFRFIVLTISTIRLNPSCDKCSFCSIISTQEANFSKSVCFIVFN